MAGQGPGKVLLELQLGEQMVQNPGAPGAHRIAKKATEERGHLKANAWPWKWETGRPIVRVWG